MIPSHRNCAFCNKERIIRKPFCFCKDCGLRVHLECITQLQSSIMTNINFLCQKCLSKNFKIMRLTQTLNFTMTPRLISLKNLQCPNDQVVKLLLDLKARVNVWNYESETPLMIAIKKNAIESVKMLLNAGSELVTRSARRESLLHIAARYAGLQVMEVLVEYGFPVNLQDCIYQTPIVFAAGRGHLPIMKYLHNKGALLETCFADGRSLLHRTTWHGHVEATKWLLEQRINPNWVNRIGWTSLHSAAALGRINIASLLLDYGADINIRTVHGESPLSVAKSYNRLQMMEFLHSKGGVE